MRHERAVAYHRAKLAQLQREISAFNDVALANGAPKVRKAYSLGVC